MAITPFDATSGFDAPGTPFDGGETSTASGDGWSYNRPRPARWTIKRVVKKFRWVVLFFGRTFLPSRHQSSSAVTGMVTGTGKAAHRADLRWTGTYCTTVRFAARADSHLRGAVTGISTRTHHSGLVCYQALRTESPHRRHIDLAGLIIGGATASHLIGVALRGTYCTRSVKHYRASNDSRTINHVTPAERIRADDAEILMLAAAFLDQ